MAHKYSLQGVTSSPFALVDKIHNNCTCLFFVHAENNIYLSHKKCVFVAKCLLIIQNERKGFRLERIRQRWHCSIARTRRKLNSRDTSASHAARSAQRDHVLCQCCEMCEHLACVCVSDTSSTAVNVEGLRRFPSDASLNVDFSSFLGCERDTWSRPCRVMSSVLRLHSSEREFYTGVYWWFCDVFTAVLLVFIS